MRADDAANQKRRYARSIAWLGVSLGFLTAGVLTGAALGSSPVAWMPPVAGFAAYVLAFRRGLLSWNADAIWREPTASRREPEERPSHPIPRAAFSRTRHAIRLVR